MKLISMTDFVLKQSERIMNCELTHLESHHQIVDYAKFLKQPLKLEMFVPCDEDGNVLEEPILENMPFCSVNGEGYDYAILKYEQSKEKVLFENYSVIKKSTYSIVIDSHGRDVWLSWNQSKTIQSLINEVTEVSLTPNAIKQLGL